jgi:hypothetical protein
MRLWVLAEPVLPALTAAMVTGSISTRPLLARTVLTHSAASMSFALGSVLAPSRPFLARSRDDRRAGFLGTMTSDEIVQHGSVLETLMWSFELLGLLSVAPCFARADLRDCRKIHAPKYMYPRQQIAKK